MKKTINIKVLALVSGAFIMGSCLNDLDRYPTNDLTSKEVYSTFEGYRSVMAKVYGSYAMQGNSTAGDSDIMTGDGASADFVRCFYNLQCMTTEEVICTWTDAGIPELNYSNWTANNTFISGMYYRSLYQITMANEFLRESTPGKLSERGITGANATEIGYYRAECRFLRAFQYWVLMDLYGNPPFVDENTTASSLPAQISRKDLFAYVENELKDIESQLRDARTNEYGRADKGAAWALMARMYLNSEVYIGQGKYTDAITYATKVIDAGYSLKPTYAHLFMADNNLNNPEVILSVNYDGKKTQGYGGLTYIINASFNKSRTELPGVNLLSYYGVDGLGGWFGNRTRKELFERFEATDTRGTKYDKTKPITDPANQYAMFIGDKADVEKVGTFEDGMSVSKFRNVTSTGAAGSNPIEMLVDTDFPLFRLAEMYLIYAEAALRGGTTGSLSAQDCLDKVRERAFGNTSHSIPATLDNILDERSRELYWEGFRRTDLVRYGLYTSGSYLWQWKNGVKDGAALADHLNIFPLPAADLTANPTLKQNPNY